MSEQKNGDKVYEKLIERVERIVAKMPLVVESEDPSRRFTATSSLGPDVSASGFIFFEGEDWIVAEATYLYGTLEEMKNGKTFETESLQAVFFYNADGKRGARLSKDCFFLLGERVLRPSSKTLGSSGPPTLMSLGAGIRFLNGEDVVPEDLYGSVIAGLKRFLNFDWDARLYDVVACIITASYFYDLFGAFPIIMVMGPFESGKTRLLLSIVYMGHRGMPILDPSEASIFRTAEAWKGFLGIDEFWEISKEIERLLRATYKRGIKVPRIDKTKGGLMYLSLFDLFGKVAIASQEPFPPNIMSKGILLQLRKMPDPNPEKRDPEPRDFEEVRAKGYIARLTWIPEVKAKAEALDKQDLGLLGRDYEVWKPALTVASMVGGQVWDSVLSYAKESCEEKRRESYEELKEVLEAIFEVVKERDGDFPVAFTPKQIHDIIWERRKDEYRVVKEKQERQGEVSEKYDYDTRRFERVYSVHKIGRNYIQQLGLKGRRKERGTEYEIRSPRDFHELVVRYHHDLPNQEKGYATLVLTSRLLQDMPDMPAEPDLHSEKVPSEAGNSKVAGIINASRKENVSLQNLEIKYRKEPAGISCNSGTIFKVPSSSTEISGPPAAEQLEPPFERVDRCANCRQHRLLRPDRFNEFYVCQECYDRQPEPRRR